MISTTKAIAFVFGVAAAGSGSKALTINSLSTNTSSLACGAEKINTLAYASDVIDSYIDSGKIGSCETDVKHNKYVVIGQEYGNMCGACINVQIGNVNENFVVFDHILHLNNETKDDIIISTKWLNSSGFDPEVAQSVAWKLIACPTEVTSESTIQFSDKERTSFVFTGIPSAIKAVSVLVEGTTTPINCTRRNLLSGYWVVPTEAQEKNFVAGVEFENGESAFVPINNEHEGTGPFNISFYNEDIEVINFSEECNVSSTTVNPVTNETTPLVPAPIEEVLFPEFEDFTDTYGAPVNETDPVNGTDPVDPINPVDDSEDDDDNVDGRDGDSSFASSPAAASSTFAAVAVAFACLF